MACASPYRSPFSMCNSISCFFFCEPHDHHCRNTKGCFILEAYQCHIIAAYTFCGHCSQVNFQHLFFFMSLLVHNYHFVHWERNLKVCSPWSVPQPRTCLRPSLQEPQFLCCRLSLQCEPFSCPPFISVAAGFRHLAVSRFLCQMAVLFLVLGGFNRKRHAFPLHLPKGHPHFIFILLRG